jgi:dTDP-4-dehydrorhamnose reductase
MHVLVTGASGQLGGYLLRELADTGTPVTAWSGSRASRVLGVPLQPVDLADADGIAAAFREARPSAVLHAAALASVAECRRDPALARQVNTQGSALLAELASQAKARLLLVSTDLVFDGECGGYREADVPAPLSVYGRTKAEAEQAVLAVPRSVVVRVSLLFGPTHSGRPAFFDEQVAALRECRPVTLFADEWRTPLDLATAARALVAVLRSDVGGLLHLGGPERLSRVDMGRRLATYLGAEGASIVAATRDSVPSAEPRPRDVSLDASRWRELFPAQPWPRFEEALAGMGLR